MEIELHECIRGVKHSFEPSTTPPPNGRGKRKGKEEGTPPSASA